MQASNSDFIQNSQKNVKTFQDGSIKYYQATVE